MQSTLGPWRVDREGSVRATSKVRFSVAPDVHEFLSEVAWDSRPAEGVSERMIQASRRDGYPVSLWLPLVAALVAYLVTHIAGILLLPSFLPDPVTAAFALIGGLVLTGGLAIWAGTRLVRFDAKFADQRIMVLLIRVIEMAEAVRKDITSVELRLQLVSAIHKAARSLDREMVFPGFSREARKLRTRHARQCAMVLKRYDDSALHGDSEAISKLKADFARAVLRVGSGNWTQIANLDPSVRVQRKTLDLLPALNPKVVATAFAPLVIQILQFVLKAANP